MGEITAVRYCPEASASLVPPDILNDCGVAVHLYKIRQGPRGKRRCMLVAQRSEIGGKQREFPYKAIRANGLWLITEAQMQDIAFRRGFSRELYDSYLKLSLQLTIWN